MKWAEISVQTTHEATEAVADLFHELGASGVVIEDPDLINSYRQSGTWDYCDIPEETETEVVTVLAYLPVDEELEDKLRRFEESFIGLVQHGLERGRGQIKWKEVLEEDWESSWKDYFHPVRVGERIVIKPSWENYDAQPEDLVIELDPGMAFGTGTHHTTAMCCRLLEEIIRPNDVVFDVGTGSGILAVAAAKLGASAIQAVDFDSVAVRVAQENVDINAVGDIVTVGQSDLLAGVTGQADVVIANIVADIIIRLLPNIPSRLKDGGRFVASGIIAERLADVTAAVLAQGMTVDKVMEEGGWVAMVMTMGG